MKITLKGENNRLNKFNALGMEVLSYKTEYLKEEYPKLVHDSIAIAIDNKENISDEIKMNLKDMSMKFDSFREYLLRQPRCLKTYEELLLEYEEIRGKIDNVLHADEITKKLQSYSKVEEENILVQQEFVITEEFIKDYFSINSDSEFDVLMSRKGFIEKFAILRLTKIFDDFIKNLEKEENITIRHGLTFFKSESNVYGIYMEYVVNIDIFENTENIEKISKKISEIAKKADENYKNHMLA